MKRQPKTKKRLPEKPVSRYQAKQARRYGGTTLGDAFIRAGWKK